MSLRARSGAYARPLAKATALAIVGGAAALIAACSSNGGGGATLSCRPNGGTEAYPLETGCGTEAGDTLAAYAFTGRKAGMTSPRETIKIADLYDPTGSKGYSYLIVDVSALWCTYCKEEAPQLKDLDAKYKAKGVVWLTVVAQDDARGIATDDDVDRWIKAYGLVTPAVSDPSSALTSFFNPDLMPLNMIVDLKTMKIVKKITGQGLPEVQAQLDAKLAGGT